MSLNNILYIYYEYNIITIIYIYYKNVNMCLCFYITFHLHIGKHGPF